MTFSGLSRLGRAACQIAGWFQPPFYGRIPLSRFGPNGYISPTAIIRHPKLIINRKCFIGDGVTIYQDREGEDIFLAEQVHLHQNTTLQNGRGGTISIGVDTHIQPRCQISAYKGSVYIGKRGEIAPNCAFYPYDHCFLAGTPIREQPFKSKGDIIIGDDVWLGFGVIVLDGVQIGHSAIIGAGSVVTKSIPENCIAVGNPARVISTRNEEPAKKDLSVPNPGKPELKIED
jgi:acetyltransferase-like isoleucine patch superfamily enzyme